MALAEFNRWARVLACVSGAAVSPTWAGPAAYELIDLGIAPGLNSSAGVAINALGHVAIGSWNSAGNPTSNTAEFWNDLDGDGEVDANERVHMGFLGGGETFVKALNVQGRAVGWSANGTGENVAFRWTPGGGLIAMESLPGIWAEAFDVNAAGVAVGRARNLPLGNSASRLHAAQWTADGQVTDITPLTSSIHTYALRINDHGDILGGRGDNNGAWVVRDGVRHFLPGSTPLAPTGLTETSDAIGYVRVNSTWQACRWVWSGAAYQFVPLPPPPGFVDSFTSAVNEKGDIVGAVSNPEDRAVIWPGGGNAVDLNSLIPPGSGWVLRSAFAINNDGAIVGYGDKDGVEFRAFLLRPSGDADTDGDGLLDSWEKNGVPYDDGMGGTAYFQLPGANWLHKDLYVEVDAMAGLSLQQGAVDQVVLAFGASPLPNPDGLDGVTLHILRDETDLPFVAAWQTNGCWPLDFDTYRSNSYGTAMERASPSAAAMLDAKAKAYRYCIVAAAFGPKAIGGCGQTPGDNFVIASYPSETDTAAVFMHELGHNLGLRHGGGDNINGKPNYPSIMNYAMSYMYDWNNDFWRLDFTRFGAPYFATLDESSLNELAGIGSANGFYDNVVMPYGVDVNNGGGTVRAVQYVKLDGSATDFGQTAGGGFQDGSFDLGVAQDLNFVAMPPPPISLPTNASPGQVFHPHDDWARVAVGLALNASLGLRGVEPEYPDDELTIEARDWIDQNFPAPPTSCLGDTNGDNVVNFTDLNAVLTDFGQSGMGVSGDVNGDNVVNFTDLNAVLSNFGVPCPE
jgi:uncharacterized membrane protein